MNIFVRVKDRNVNTGNITISREVVVGHTRGIVTGLTVAEDDSVKESYYDRDLAILIDGARWMGNYYLAKRHKDGK